MQDPSNSAVCFDADVLVAVPLHAVLVPVVDFPDSDLAGTLD
jgi:hypothetical protein